MPVVHERVTDCAYCGCRIENHDPVVVSRPTDDGTDAIDDTDQVGAFCNYGCLAAHIETAGLAVGTTCEWEPDG